MSRVSMTTAASAACLLALAAGCRRLEQGEAGVCLEVEKVSGVQLEDGQDETSVQTVSASYVGPATADTYVTIHTSSSGEGEFEFYFSVPSLLTEDPTLATSMHVEFLALVPTEGSGGNWLVDVYNREDDTGWETIGDLSAVLSNWSPVILTVDDTLLTNYIDDESSEILVRVYTDTDVTDTEQLAYIDFAQLMATSGVVPTPAPAAATVPSPAPVATPERGTPGGPLAPIACFQEQIDTSDDDNDEDGYYSVQKAAETEEDADMNAEADPSSASSGASGGLLAVLAGVGGAASLLAW